MTVKLQTYLKDLTVKQAKDFEQAYLNIPYDKRGWSPSITSRTAIDQLAEVALVNLKTASTLTLKSRPPGYDFNSFKIKKAELAANESAALELFHRSVTLIADAIEAVLDDDLAFVIEYPWGAMTLAEVISYPEYNMSYHEGQINYIASLLGCL